MRTKEERLLDVIGDTKDRNVLAAVGHENADPEMKTDVHHVEFREVPKLPEKDLKRMRIRNAILGGLGAAAVIAGGIVLWNSLQNNTIGTNPAQQSSTEPVVTIYQPGGSDDVSVTEEDRFEQITDTSMPLPFEYYDSRFNSIFQDLWVNKFTTISNKLLELSDNDKDLELMSKLSQIRCETPYTLDGNDGTMNLYWWMTELGLTIDKVYDAIENNNEYYRTRENFKDMIYTDEELAALRSEDRNKIAETFASEYCIVIGEKVFSPKWLYYHTGDDYTKAGITAAQVEIMMPLYEKLGLTDEAWAAFSAKLNRFIEENKKPEEKRRYVIPNDETDMTETLITGDSALKILEERFYGTWKRTPATGGDYDTLTFTYNYDYEERNLMGFDFDFEGFHRPFAIGETDDIWYMECINSGESEVFVIEKSEPKVMYCTGLIYYNGFDSSPAVDLSEDWVARYEYEETLIDKTVRPGEISVLGLDKLINIYGADFEQFFRESIEQGFDTDDGKHYVPGDDMMTAKSRRYLVTRDENSVTLGIRFYEQTEYESYLNYEYPADDDGVEVLDDNYPADDDGVEVLDDNDEPQPPTEHYFAVTFRKDENGWTFGYGQLSDVYADLPAQIYRSSQTDRYVTELTLNGTPDAALYDPYENRLYKPEIDTRDGKTVVKLRLEPCALRVLILGGEAMEAEPLPDIPTGQRLIEGWRVSTATAKEYPAFTPCPAITEPTNLNRPDGLPRFSGTIRYEGTFEAKAGERLTLELGEVGETAEVLVNGRSAGVRLQSPYRFDLTGLTKDGQNELTIDVTNTLVYRMHDGFSAYHAIAASGLIGPVRLSGLA